MANGIYYIYKITNKINNKIYIGFTGTTLENRLREHINSSRYFKSKMILHKAIRKYGEKNFIIEELDRSYDKNYCLNILENYYISLYNSTNKNIGYNIRFGGQCGKFTNESKKKLSNSLKVRFSDPKYIHPLRNKSYEEYYGEEKAKIIKNKISLHHNNVNGKNNPMYGKNIKNILNNKQYIKWKTANIGHKSKLSKEFIIINPKTNEILYKGKGLNEFTKKIGYTYSSTLKRFIKNGKPIKTKHKTIYEGCIIKYIN